VNRASSLVSPRWALVLLAASALTGTKDQQTTNTTVPPPTDTEAQRAATPSVFNPAYGSDAAPAAGRGSKKPFVLDPLLNSN
jgi:hypothetical protein